MARQPTNPKPKAPARVRQKVKSAEKFGPWSNQLWDCELSCGHKQRVKGRLGGQPLTALCDTCKPAP